MMRWILAVIVAATAGVTGPAFGDEETKSPSLKWEEAIQAFEKQAAETPIAPGGVLFVGSSSIRMWDLPKWFPGMPTVNRGFGGSEIADSIYYFDRIVTPCQPAAIVFYAGDNDIARGKLAEQVFEDYKAFAAKVHEALPDSTLFFIAIKPSIARRNLYGEMKKANDLIKTYAETQEKEHFIDIGPPMIDDKGNAKKDLLLEDGLHMTDGGYQIWTDMVKPPLEALLAPAVEEVVETALSSVTSTPAEPADQ